MTDTTWTPATYRIARRNGESDVTGVRLGVFGVGPSVDWGDHWTVTHLPTGYGIKNDCTTEAEARRLAEGLLPLRNDWPRVTRETRFTAAFRRQIEALAERVRRGEQAEVTR